MPTPQTTQKTPLLLLCFAYAQKDSLSFFDKANATVALVLLKRNQAKLTRFTLGKNRLP